DRSSDEPVLVVRDTRKTLADIARWHRRTLRGKVVAVAGSNGKTSTKLLIHSVLRTTLRGSASPKSFNNDIGVPLTLLAADTNDDYVVVEVGTNHPGEIANLTDIARPDIAVVTSIGHEHLEGLGDLNGVRRENLAILQITEDHSTPAAIVHGGDEAFVRASRRFCRALTTFGDCEADLTRDDVKVGFDGTSFRSGGRRWSVPHLGRHAASNALAAIAVGRQFGLSGDDIAAGLASADVPPMRLNVRQLPSGVVLLDDSYNANPESVRAALDLLADLPTTGRRVAILGDMLELGQAGPDKHRDALRHARTVADVVVTVGPIFAEEGDAKTHFDTAADVPVESIVQPNDLVLLKASRGMKLETIAERLASDQPLSAAA
ncbi:MAG: UDP-N-acetylmuramoyl-tripeptide--D-alanyl-D-alanine ligase, partial [Planctomycetota bacterium]